MHRTDFPFEFNVIERGRPLYRDGGKCFQGIVCTPKLFKDTPPGDLDPFFYSLWDPESKKYLKPIYGTGVDGLSSLEVVREILTEMEKEKVDDGAQFSDDQGVVSVTGSIEIYYPKDLTPVAQYLGREIKESDDASLFSDKSHFNFYPYWDGEAPTQPTYPLAIYHAISSGYSGNLFFVSFKGEIKYDSRSSGGISLREITPRVNYSPDNFYLYFGDVLLGDQDHEVPGIFSSYSKDGKNLVQLLDVVIPGLPLVHRAGMLNRITIEADADREFSIELDAFTELGPTRSMHPDCSIAFGMVVERPSADYIGVRYILEKNLGEKVLVRRGDSKSLLQKQTSEQYIVVQ